MEWMQCLFGQVHEGINLRASDVLKKMEKFVLENRKGKLLVVCFLHHGNDKNSLQFEGHKIYIQKLFTALSIYKHQKKVPS